MNTPTIRPPAVAGTFYSDRPEKLAAAVENLLSQARDAELGPVQALIAPHAGYRYSGPVAASAFQQLERARSAPPGCCAKTGPSGVGAGGIEIDRSGGARPTVYLLGPAHYVYVESVALSPADAFETPLGLVPQNRAAIDELLARGRAYQLDALAHQPEHSLEVELPFLQATLGDFDLVAMLCGQPDVAQVAGDLAQQLRPGDLVVVSSDLSHYHPHEVAQRLDHALLEAVLAGDAAAASQGEACGLQPILILMRLAQLKDWTPHLLDARNSGDTSGDKSRVVGYSAVVYGER
jgi:AmmeMemoRadiSam system protein B